MHCTVPVFPAQKPTRKKFGTRDGDKAVAILYGSGIVHADGACGGGGADVSSADAEVLHDACLCTVVGIDAESIVGCVRLFR